MAVRAPRYVFGSDVGGTFTDTVLLDRATGRTWSAKVPTRARSQEESVAQGIRLVLEHAAADDSALEHEATAALHHGSTTATNALLERRMAPTAFLTNEGFEDLIQIRRQDRPHLYDTRVTRPPPLVARDLRIGVPYRRGPDGTDWRDEDGSTEPERLEAVLDRLRQARVAAVAIGLLHADLHPEDEARLARDVREALPGIAVVASHEVWPEFREVERFETTIMNAALTPLLGQYLARLEDAARRATQRDTRVHVLDSAATLRPIQAAARLPASLLLSGPAGGVRAAQGLAQALGIPAAITLDVGGTSTDVALVMGETPRLAMASRIGGYTCRFPAVDLHTLGAGGGSVLWRDAGGHLQVGPKSQGAKPGPACYGLGGEEATLTDAFLLTGRIPATIRLAGRMRLDRDAAHRVLERLAGKFRMDALQTALGAIRVAVAAIAGGVRVITSERGHDPRGAALLAFGGAGGLLAAELAEALAIQEVVVPPDAGVFSALGMATAPIVARVALGLDHVVGGDEDHPATLAASYDEAARRLAHETGAEDGHVTARVALHYDGQSHELEVPMAPDDSDATLRARFHAIHQTTYGHRHPSRAVRAVRLVMERSATDMPHEWRREVTPVEPPTGLPLSTTLALPSAVGNREQECRVAWRASLAPGQDLGGPLVVLDGTQTTYLPPGWQLRVDAKTGALRMTRRLED